MSKTERQALVKALDDVVSLIVREIDDYKCITPTKKCCQIMTNGHLITRSKHSVRWDLMNCNCQCRNHNFSHEHNPHPYTARYIKIYGVEEYEKLLERSYKVAKFKIFELIEMLDWYTNAYKKVMLEKANGKCFDKIKTRIELTYERFK